MPNKWIEHVKQFAADNKVSYMCAIADPRTKETYTKTEKPKSEKPKTETPKTEKPIKQVKLTYEDIINIENEYTDYDKENQYIILFKFKEDNRLPYQPGWNSRKPILIKEDTILYKNVNYTVRVYDKSFYSGVAYDRKEMINKLKKKEEKEIKKLSKLK
jgi:hypothetical protein